ncbi:hypothetical protein A7982_12010 [Minicystis rosea]|nr:hypothetical protein A7982_12010 [Minicystis rosea]
MPRHEQRDITFDVPRHWDDKTIVAYAAPPQPGQAVAANLVMTRDTLRDGETLAQYADRQLTEMAKRLDAFELVGREDTAVGGSPATVIRFTARAVSGPLAQRLVVIQGRRRGVYCLTATSARADAAQNDPLFDRILGSIRFPAVEPGAGPA